MQNLFNKLMDKIGVPSLLVLLALLGVSYGMLLGKNAIINYEYNTFTAPFLANGVMATHSPSKLATTIQTSQIEYQVLKVQGSKTTAVKK